VNRSSAHALCEASVAFADELAVAQMVVGDDSVQEAQEENVQVVRLGEKLPRYVLAAGEETGV